MERDSTRPAHAASALLSTELSSVLQPVVDRSLETALKHGSCVSEPMPSSPELGLALLPVSLHGVECKLYHVITECIATILCTKAVVAQGGGRDRT